MTPIQLAGRLKAIAGQKPTDIWRELHALAADILDDAEFADALKAQAALHEAATPDQLATARQAADLRASQPESEAVADPEADIEAIMRAIQKTSARTQVRARRRRWWR
jgi:hypothetical protein